MPKIVKSYGIQMSDEVFCIKDAAKKKKPPTAKDFVAEEFEGMSDAPEKTTEEAAAQEAENLELADGRAEYDAPDIAELSAQISAEIEGEIVQRAMEQAGKIIEDAVAKAEDEKQKVLLKAQYEAERIREEAAQRGRQEAYAKASEELKGTAGQIENLIASIEGERAGFEAEYEEQLKWFAAEIASKVLAKKVEENDAVLLEMVQKTIQNVHQEPWVKVSVAEQMVGLIEKLQEVYEQAPNIEIAGTAGAAGTIQVETQNGIIDASMATQLENLKEYFVAAE